MCAEKIQRFLMAIVLTAAMLLFANNQMLYAMIIQTLVIVMVVVWALFDFCPSLWVFKKVFGKCPQKD
ncbi:MAG: phosphoribosylaminoimidazole synthetase [Sulfuricurvum sp.]|uniref:phosphoribosylaminoimidazole synthetase n=1 Tax=Sulfuricurvum sp. TaxID=2025608 RepID=UPI0026036689|nr:phosphoribosylaminoimidazole synthetase [Sulfuricurvum sp.]MDD2369349.1 phosphoribosylaminoimidazole synthetase [Sulfuricurvum sp.]MDD2950728.1 phosphoribosylaminoimidazole synthetase [Sulfuricurvum sp.]MDD5117763.1 phosphoribosylaminoimidazole synthetase [Sulfuricurvum sp.]